MSKPIEGVSEKIETCAKKEFLDKGYVDASLHTIAAEAGTTTGSIYSRYGGKEGLFSALVEPAAITRGLGADRKRTNVCQIGFHAQDYILFTLCVIPYVIWAGALIRSLIV